MDERFLSMSRNCLGLALLIIVIIVIRNIQDRVQNTSENIEGTARTYAILSAAIESVLISIWNPAGNSTDTGFVVRTIGNRRSARSLSL